MNNGSKTRYFSLITYATIEENITDLQKKGTSLNGYALIRHDKDEKEPHNHIVIRTIGTWTPKQIQRWFQGHSDTEGRETNVLVEAVHDRTAIVEYLTHENDPDKHHYEKSEIIDGGIDKLLPAGETKDDAFEILETLERGTSIREMCRLYGREFIYHYSNYCQILDAMRKEEGKR